MFIELPIRESIDDEFPEMHAIRISTIVEVEPMSDGCRIRRFPGHADRMCIWPYEKVMRILNSKPDSVTRSI